MLGITEYLYDENGSLVSEKEGEKTASYQYDLLNRQTHVKTFEGKEQENFYDGEGLRAGIKEDGKTSTFLFLNGEILAESDGNREPVRRHLSGLGLSHMEDIGTGILHTYHQDEQGSTAYIAGRDGAVENGYIYDAFGNVLESRENVRNRILYTGQQYDQEIGQYYLRARYYNPVIGRFTQEDAYRGDGLNLYAYCGNNPVMYYDPSGYNSGFGTCPPSNQENYVEKKDIGKDSTSSDENLKVIASFEHNGQIYDDVNPTARNSQYKNDTVIPAPEGQRGLSGVNKSMDIAHAEIGAMNQSYLAGNRGGDATLTVVGAPICDYCRQDIKKMG